MWLNNVQGYGADILLSIFAVYLFVYYFDIFFYGKNDKRLFRVGLAVFALWQFGISTIISLPVYVNICVTIVVTLLSIMIVYVGGFWNKCIFALTFNAIWMLIETLSGYILSINCDEALYPQIYKILGSFISKILFLIVIFALKKVFTNEEIKELSAKYNIMFIMIPIGSIYIMNDIFLLGKKAENNLVNVHSIVSAIILLAINVLIFYIYMKLADDLRLRRMTSVYEQQLELCERHQQERELSTLQLRDARHNMKNNLVSILAYAENKEYEKIIGFVNEVMGEGGMTITAVSNSGNIVIDSLLGYWYVTAQKMDIDFSVDICIPMIIPFKGADISLVLGNLLENAVEAAQKAEREKYIKVRIKYDKNNLLLFVANSYNGNLIKTKNRRLKSTKSDVENHGVGLPSVHRVATKYHGTVVIDDTVPERFGIRILLYGNKE